MRPSWTRMSSVSVNVGRIPKLSTVRSDRDTGFQVLRCLALQEGVSS